MDTAKARDRSQVLVPGHDVTEPGPFRADEHVLGMTQASTSLETEGQATPNGDDVDDFSHLSW